MGYFTTGGPGKGHGTNKPPPTRRVQERSKEDTTCQTVAGRGTPPRAPNSQGSCLTLGNELSEETHVLTKQEILLGKDARVESSRVREPRRTALPRGLWLTVLGFMVMGLVSGLSLANHSDSESFLVVHALFSQDGC